MDRLLKLRGGRKSPRSQNEATLLGNEVEESGGHYDYTRVDSPVPSDRIVANIAGRRMDPDANSEQDEVVQAVARNLNSARTSPGYDNDSKSMWDRRVSPGYYSQGESEILSSRRSDIASMVSMVSDAYDSVLDAPNVDDILSDDGYQQNERAVNLGYSSKCVERTVEDHAVDQEAKKRKNLLSKFRPLMASNPIKKGPSKDADEKGAIRRLRSLGSSEDYDNERSIRRMMTFGSFSNIKEDEPIEQTESNVARSPRPVRRFSNPFNRGADPTPEVSSPVLDGRTGFSAGDVEALAIPRVASDAPSSPRLTRRTSAPGPADWSPVRSNERAASPVSPARRGSPSVSSSSDGETKSTRSRTIGEDSLTVDDSGLAGLPQPDFDQIKALPGEFKEQFNELISYVSGTNEADHNDNMDDVPLPLKELPRNNRDAEAGDDESSMNSTANSTLFVRDSVFMGYPADSGSLNTAPSLEELNIANRSRAGTASPIAFLEETVAIFKSAVQPRQVVTETSKTGHGKETVEDATPKPSMTDEEPTPPSTAPRRVPRSAPSPPIMIVETKDRGSSSGQHGRQEEEKIVEDKQLIVEKSEFVEAVNQNPAAIVTVVSLDSQKQPLKDDGSEETASSTVDENMADHEESPETETDGAKDRGLRNSIARLRRSLSRPLSRKDETSSVKSGQSKGSRKSSASRKSMASKKSSASRKSSASKKSVGSRRFLGRALNRGKPSDKGEESSRAGSVPKNTLSARENAINSTINSILKSSRSVGLTSTEGSKTEGPKKNKTEAPPSQPGTQGSGSNARSSRRKKARDVPDVVGGSFDDEEFDNSSIGSYDSEYDSFVEEDRCDDGLRDALTLTFNDFSNYFLDLCTCEDGKEVGKKKRKVRRTRPVKKGGSRRFRLSRRSPKQAT